MANLSNRDINFSGIKDILLKFFKNLTWLFFVFFLLLLALEIFEVKTSVGIVLNINQAPVVVTNDKGVRINFDAYNTVVNRILAAPNFQPTGGITKDPFIDSLPAPASQISPTPTPASASTTASSTNQ